MTRLAKKHSSFNPSTHTYYIMEIWIYVIYFLFCSHFQKTKNGNLARNGKFQYLKTEKSASKKWIFLHRVKHSWCYMIVAFKCWNVEFSMSLQQKIKKKRNDKKSSNSIIIIIIAFNCHQCAEFSLLVNFPCKRVPSQLKMTKLKMSTVFFPPWRTAIHVSCYFIAFIWCYFTLNYTLFEHCKSCNCEWNDEKIKFDSHLEMKKRLISR